MVCKQALAAVALNLILAACSQPKEEPFPYPKMVVDAHEQAHYKTALWGSYTGNLDCSTFKKQPLSDSLMATLQGWLAVRRKLKSLQQGTQNTCFRFELVGPYPTILRLLNNAYRYSRNPSGLSPVVAIWVSNQDGLIDSVLTYDNMSVSPGPGISQIKGKWTVTGDADRNTFSFNVNQPGKAVLLQSSRNRMNKDLVWLCKERKVFTP